MHRKHSIKCNLSTCVGWPGHRGRPSECSWPRWCPCWPSRKRPPWTPARRTSFCPCRFPARGRDAAQTNPWWEPCCRRSVAKKPPEPHLHGQVGNDGPLVAFQCLQRDLSDLRLRLSHEHLARCRQHLLVLTLDFHLHETVTHYYCKRCILQFCILLLKTRRQWWFSHLHTTCAHPVFYLLIYCLCIFYELMANDWLCCGQTEFTFSQRVSRLLAQRTLTGSTLTP